MELPISVTLGPYLIEVVLVEVRRVRTRPEVNDPGEPRLFSSESFEEIIPVDADPESHPSVLESVPKVGIPVDGDHGETALAGRLDEPSPNKPRRPGDE